MVAKAEYKCASCNKPFTARTADRARGWARHCSKSCAVTTRTADQIKQVQRARPWQRYDKCETVEDAQDLMRNPRIIAPLYNEDGERDGEEFFAGGEAWDHN